MDRAWIPQRLADAMNLHQRGQVEQAGAVYREILEADPNHAEATHLLGVCAFQTGRTADAETLIRKGIALGAAASAHNNLGEVLRAAARPQEALAEYQRSIELQPVNPDAFCNLAGLLLAAGQVQQALACVRQSLVQNPQSPNAHFVHGSILAATNALDEAISAFDNAIRLQPSHLAAMSALGAVLTRRGRAERAVAVLRRALELAPNFLEAHGNLAEALSKLQRHDEAIAAASKTVAMAPSFAPAHNLLGTVLQSAGRLDDARSAFEKSRDLDPRFVHAHGNLGALLRTLGHYQDAVRELETAIELLPNNPDALNTLSAAYRSAGRPREAVEAAEKAIAIAPGHTEAHGNLALSLLAAGDYKRGFHEYEWRWRCENFTTSPRDFDRPMWDGSDPAGRTILVHAEQGFGDVIQFARYLPLLAQRGATVFLEVSPPLRALFENMSCLARVIPAGLKPPDFDLHCPLLSLPRAFGTTLETVPSTVPYLAAPDELVAKWSDKLGAKSSRLRIALTWGGNKVPDPKRSCPLREIEPLLGLPDIEWISVQKGEPADELGRCVLASRVRHVAPDIRDFADTAAILKHVDLLLTIDTGVAHLGGATATRTWVMLPWPGDWRWLADRNDSPWYPTVRLFRQPEVDNWAAVVGNVREALAQLCNVG